VKTTTPVLKVRLCAVLCGVALLTTPLFRRTLTAIPLSQKSAAKTPTKASDPDLTKPSGCVAAIQKYSLDISREYRDAMQSDEDYRRMVEPKVSARAAEYARRFSIEKVDGPELMQLAQLYARAGEWNKVRGAIRKRLEPQTLTAGQRADILSEAAMMALNNSSAGADEEAKTLAEGFERDLEQLGKSTLPQQLKVCGRLVTAYGNDGDAKVETCAQRYIASYPKLSPADRSKLSDLVYFVYKSLADYYAGRGEYAHAAETTRQAITALSANPQSPDLKYWLKAAEFDLGRYAQVGKRAQPITAAYWINGTPPNGELSLDRKVTVLEFTATWCVTCRGSYPALLALQKKYKDAGVEVILATRLWGKTTGDLSPEQEYRKNEDYFVGELHLPFKIAVAFLPPEKINNFAEHDSNSANYFAQGIPQFVVIDRHGIIRDVTLDWNPSQAEKLTRYVEESLHAND
jgi:thiol-disulfide isomerase/thioredoxin